MGVTEWPGGQRITAGLYWRNAASISKLLLIGQGRQTEFFNKSNKRGNTSQLSIFSDCVLFYHAYQVISTQICFDAYFPCVGNCWASPRGPQKIVHIDWGSTCRKVWEPLS